MQIIQKEIFLVACPECGYANSQVCSHCRNCGQSQDDFERCFM